METRSFELKNELEKIIHATVESLHEKDEPSAPISMQPVTAVIFEWLMTNPEQAYERLAVCITLIAEKALFQKNYAAIKQDFYGNIVELLKAELFSEFNHRLFYHVIHDLNPPNQNYLPTWRFLTQIYDACAAQSVALTFQSGFDSQFEKLDETDKKMLVADCPLLLSKSEVTALNHYHLLDVYAKNILNLGIVAYANGIFNIYRYINEKMSNDETILLAQQMLHSPHQFQSLIALIKKPRKLEIFDAGNNPNNWTIFSKALMDVLHNNKTLPVIKKDLHQVISNQIADQSPLPESTITKEIKDFHFVKQLGRTFIFQMPNGRYRAYKVQKKAEKLEDLRKEEITLKTIREYGLALQSNLPTAIATYAMSTDDERTLKAFGSKDESLVQLFATDHPHVFVYETESLDYFTYLHDANLSDATLLSSAMTSFHDIFLLAQYNIFCNNLADLYHVSSQARLTREDQGRYLLLNDLIRLDDPSFYQGRGKLSNIDEAARYPNLRKGTLADVGDHASFSEVKASFPNKEVEMYANFIAEPLLVLELILSHKQLSHAQKDHEQWRQTVKSILLVASYQLHLYSQLPLDICHRFIVANVEENQYANQLEFWMQPDKYVPHINANTVPTDLYDPQLNVVVDNKAFRKGTYDSTLGFTASDNKQMLHRAATNSVDPVIESAKLGYVVGTFALTSLESKALYKKATQQMAEAITNNDWREAGIQCKTALTLNPHSRYLNHVMSTINKKLDGQATHDHAWQKLQRKYREKKFQKHILKK